MNKIEFFTEKDFWDLGLIDIRRNEAARRCNEKLNEKLGPVVYGCKDRIYLKYISWHPESMINVPTHKAYLFNIEEIKKEECKHEPISDRLCKRNECNLIYQPICKHCGIELEATWSTKK